MLGQIIFKFWNVYNEMSAEIDPELKRQLVQAKNLMDLYARKN